MPKYGTLPGRLPPQVSRPSVPVRFDPPFQFSVVIASVSVPVFQTTWKLLVVTVRVVESIVVWAEASPAIKIARALRICVV